MSLTSIREPDEPAVLEKTPTREPGVPREAAEASVGGEHSWPVKPAQPGRPHRPDAVRDDDRAGAWWLLLPVACCGGPLLVAAAATGGALAWGALGAAAAALGALIAVRRRAGCCCDCPDRPRSAVRSASTEKGPRQ